MSFINVVTALYSAINEGAKSPKTDETTFELLTCANPSYVAKIDLIMLYVLPQARVRVGIQVRKRNINKESGEIRFLHDAMQAGF